jgi:hypothetical protein
VFDKLTNLLEFSYFGWLSKAFRNRSWRESFGSILGRLEYSLRNRRIEA